MLLFFILSHLCQCFSSALNAAQSNKRDNRSIQIWTQSLRHKSQTVVVWPGSANENEKYSYDMIQNTWVNFRCIVNRNSHKMNKNYPWVIPGTRSVSKPGADNLYQILFYFMYLLFGKFVMKCEHIWEYNRKLQASASIVYN